MFRLRGRRRKPPVAALLLLLGGTSSARAEHADVLFAGPELRTRRGENSEPVYEVALTHGAASASQRTAMVGRLGWVVPAQGSNATILPVAFGLRLAPFATRLRPFVGGEVGGYLVLPHGSPPAGQIGGPPWCWSTRALTGIMLVTSRSTALTVYADATWVQPPHDPVTRLHFGSGFGGGIELAVFFAPDMRFVDMFLHGTEAPEGF